MAFLQPRNLLDILSKSKKCSTGCPILDLHLAGGIPCNSITEIVGESGTGKTQICLQVALRAQASNGDGGLEGSTIYLYTDYAFPHKRLAKLASHSPSSSRGSVARPCDHIFVKPVFNADHLVEQLGLVDAFIQNSPQTLPVRVLIIDSLASLFRYAFSDSVADLCRRSAILFRLATKLKLLADRHNLAVLVTNQVGACIGNSYDDIRIGNLPAMYSSGNRIYPTLGMGWANCVNSRLFLAQHRHRSGDDVGDEPHFEWVRRLWVIFSPHLEPNSVLYDITVYGVRGIERPRV